MTVTYATIAEHFELVIQDIITELGFTIDLIEVVGSLPTASKNTMNKLYLVAESTSATYDNYEIFVTVKSGSTYSWEKVDTARIDLSGKADATHSHGSITNDGKVGTAANKPLITGTGGLVKAGSFGTTANTFCQGNDSRLSDARTPTSHTHTKSEITDFPTSMTPASHTHGSLTNGGTLNSDISSVNKIAVTDSSNNLKTISKLPADKVTHQDISGKIDTAGTGLSKTGTTLNHSNSVTAQTTNALKKIAFDAQGHITGTANVAASDLPSNIPTSKISGLATVATSGSYNDLDNKPSIPGVVDTVADGDSNAVSSNAVYDYIETILGDINDYITG